MSSRAPFSLSYRGVTFSSSLYRGTTTEMLPVLIVCRSGLLHALKAPKGEYRIILDVPTPPVLRPKEPPLALAERGLQLAGDVRVPYFNKNRAITGKAIKTRP